MNIYRFRFSKVSDGFRDYTIETLDFTAKNKRQAKKDAVACLTKEKKYLEAAQNLLTPKQAVARATITAVVKRLELIEIRCRARRKR